MARTVPQPTLIKQNPSLFKSCYHLHNDATPMNKVSSTPSSENKELPRNNMKIKISFNHGKPSKPKSVATAPRKGKRTFTVSPKSTAIIKEEKAPLSTISHRAPSPLHNFTFPTTPNLEWGTLPPLIRHIKLAPTVELIKEAPPLASKADDQSVLATKGLSESGELPWNLRRKRALSKVGSCNDKPAAGVEREVKRKLTVPLSYEEIEADFVLLTGKKPHRRPKKRPRHVQKEVDDIVPGILLSTVTLDMYKVVQ